MEFFLFYLGNVAAPSLEGKQKARALIKYSRGEAFGIVYEHLAEDGELSEDGKSYTNVKNILRY